jgi:hypothetical protein
MPAKCSGCSRTAISSQPTPQVIPKLEIDRDPSGAVETLQPAGSTITANNAFFLDIGTNGRTCFTCHEPQDGWTISAQHVRDRFTADANDPLFRLFDGATCPSDDVSTPQAMRKAYTLLLDKGLIRIGLPMPATAQFQILNVSDPYGCNTNPTTGLTSPSTGIVSVYRRPLPSTNLGFLSTIMWDGREPSLFSQAVDATLTHAQAGAAPSPAQQQQIVTFELASAGLLLPVIGALLGHTQPGTTARYTHLFDDPLRAATERVGAIVMGGKARPPTLCRSGRADDVPEDRRQSSPCRCRGSVSGRSRKRSRSPRRAGDETP